MKTHPIRALLLCAALFAPALAAAPEDEDHRGPERVDERRPVKADARISISNVSGALEIQAWDRAEVHVTGELGEGAEKLEITGSEGDLKIAVKIPRGARDVEDSYLQVRLPAGATLVADTVSADISVQGLRGETRVNSVSGELRLDVAAPRIEARTVSGDVTLQASEAKSVVFNSVSGDVQLRGVRGELRGETVSGNVQLDGRDLRQVRVKTVSGDATLHVTLAPDADVEVDTLSGQLELHLPASASAKVAVSTFSGEIVSDFGSPQRDAKNLEQVLGAGKGSVGLHSFSGDVSVHKK